MEVGHFPLYTVVVAFFMGSAIGSFLNALIYRLPRGLSMLEPKHSFCPKCKNSLTPIDLVPIFSWAFLGGKCRQCKAPISPRYMIVELITGALWGGIWFVTLVQAADPIKFTAYALFAAALIVAIFTDLAHYIIPDEINFAMLIIGLLYQVALTQTKAPNAFTWGIPSALAGWLVGWGVLWGIALFGRLAFGKDAMGHGDIKLARGIGAVLFPQLALMSFGLAVVLGAVIGILVVVYRKTSGKADKPEDEAEEEPYEPESIGSLFKCGLGYLLAFDGIGLFFPKFYKAWFDEDPYADETIDDDSEVELTMIPFGPPLAVGAITAMLFAPQLQDLVDAYWKNFYGT